MFLLEVTVLPDGDDVSWQGWQWNAPKTNGYFFKGIGLHLVTDRLSERQMASGGVSSMTTSILIWWIWQLHFPVTSQELPWAKDYTTTILQCQRETNRKKIKRDIRCLVHYGGGYSLKQTCRSDTLMVLGPLNSHVVTQKLGVYESGYRRDLATQNWAGKNHRKLWAIGACWHLKQLFARCTLPYWKKRSFLRL